LGVQSTALEKLTQAAQLAHEMRCQAQESTLATFLQFNISAIQNNKLHQNTNIVSYDQLQADN